MSTALRRAVVEAKRVIDELKIKKPSEIDIELIAAYYDVFARYRTLQHEEGHLLRTDKTGVVAVDEAALETKKWRFVIAHELGHHRLHGHINQLQLCTNQDLHQWYQKGGYESEANAFAAELLMPESMFEPRCDVKVPSLHIVKELAKVFQTSLTSTALRFVKFCPEPCAVVYSVDGVISWWDSSDDFAFTLRRGHHLTSKTYAGDLFSGEEVDDEPLSVGYGSAWSLHDSRAADIDDLQEHSIMFENYNAVLSLLFHQYVDKDEEEEY